MKLVNVVQVNRDKGIARIDNALQALVYCGYILVLNNLPRDLCHYLPALQTIASHQVYLVNTKVAYIWH